ASRPQPRVPGPPRSRRDRRPRPNRWRCRCAPGAALGRAAWRPLRRPQPGPHRALSIMFMRLWVAEIDEHPIAHVFGYKTVEPGDRLRDALMIRADYRTQILRVELGRERRRANEVGEHHGELATLRIVPSLLF